MALGDIDGVALAVSGLWLDSILKNFSSLKDDSIP